MFFVRWIAVRLEFVGICVSFSAALFAVVGRDLPSLFVSPDKIGLTISYSLAINQILNWFVRMTSDMESNIVSVERMKEYSQITTEVLYLSLPLSNATDTVYSRQSGSVLANDRRQTGRQQDIYNWSTTKPDIAQIYI